MSRAFTVRLRTIAPGAHVMSIAPAAGFGFSTSCCEAGHPSEMEAVAHGILSLETKFLAEVSTAVS